MNRNPSSEFNRVKAKEIRAQIINEIRKDYEFPSAICRSLADLFTDFLDLYAGGIERGGQVQFQAADINVPPGVPVKDMHLRTVHLTVYHPNDCDSRSQGELLNQRILRLTNEAFDQDALLTITDLSVLLGRSPRSLIRHIKALNQSGHYVKTRGKWKDIGPGVSHKKQIVELYLRGKEYTDIERQTRHCGDSIKRYLKSFSRVLILSKEGYHFDELRVLSGLSERVLREYLELIDQYDGSAYEDRINQLLKIFQKKRFVILKAEDRLANGGVER